MADVELTIAPCKTSAGLPYQHLHIQITADNGLITPVDLKGLNLPKTLIPSQGVVIEGKAPIWLYGYLVHACHASAWVGCFDPRLGGNFPHSGGAVVIETHSPLVDVGQVIEVEIPDEFYSA
ncbi:crispr-associated csx3 family [Leptolyngbya sp. Heron Island J]|uniref:CRISPR-associated ring nuclease Crn3/Csx3 n=1 Tax=Leptolyngbya sp. Heron Island J TaxID=1385935 RepID=UPI0003B9D7C3|nr:CRISPR-associated ring nuclease Crn3/Csx3 [Leptolyngbya sp. Heron Island J]ESA34651.1 crispr-associated csx3 family [Leptolyngbya sp. Heron Island J]